jgi:hypothetical protein
MLGAMDSSAAATGPLVVLGVAVLGLLVLAVVAVVVLRRGPAVPPPAASGPDEPTRTALHRDDLADFHARPPGFPGARDPAPAGEPVPLFASSPVATEPGVGTGFGTTSATKPDGGLRVAPFLLALAALALLLVAGAAAAALPSARGAESNGSPASSSPAPGPATADPTIPALTGLPADSAHAGELAYTTLPMGRSDTSARLEFAGLVLERQAVGVTVTYPGSSLSTSGNRALVHLRLPTWNCLTADAPSDPAEAGCVPSVTEYGDLPTPALRMARDGNRLVLEGRIPTYTRPNGSAPVYTGRVYDLALTVSPGRRLAANRAVAEAVLTLGSESSRTDGNPSVDVLERGR